MFSVIIVLFEAAYHELTFALSDSLSSQILLVAKTNFIDFGILTFHREIETSGFGVVNHCLCIYYQVYSEFQDNLNWVNQSDSNR